jgi:hypothetical protein
MSESDKVDIVEEERRLVEEMRKLPDFASFLFPQSWYKKYNIPPVEAVGPREYIKNNHALKMAIAPKDLPPIFIDEPQKDAEGKVKLAEVPEIVPVPMEVVQRPLPEEEIKNGRTPDIHPGLRDPVA